jgi:hypothetical protein
MRFDSVEHVTSWKETGVFPLIHTAFASFVAARAQGRRVLDLCCNQGLLGEQLMARVRGLRAFGIDDDATAVRRGLDAGVHTTFKILHIDPSTYDELALFMRRNVVDVVVARRCLPELLDPVMWSAGDFAQALRDGGAAEVFLQGRVPTPTPANRLHSIDQEVAALASSFTLREKVGPMAYLVANGVEVSLSARLS